MSWRRGGEGLMHRETEETDESEESEEPDLGFFGFFGILSLCPTSKTLPWPPRAG
jgi:hypothetical protein